MNPATIHSHTGPRPRRVALLLLLLVAIGVAALCVVYAVTPTTIVPELHVGVVGAYDETSGAQLTGGQFFLGEHALPGTFSVPVRTHEEMYHHYNDANLHVHSTIDVPPHAGFEELIQQLFPGSRLVEPCLGPTTMTSTNQSDVDPTVHMWRLFLTHADGSLDSCALLVFANIYRDERVALVLRGKRNGSQWLGEVTLEDYRPVIQGGWAGFKRQAWGHLLSISVGRMRSLEALPEELKSRRWFDPKAKE